MLISALDAPRRPLAEIDPALTWSALLLLLGGLVMVYSASIAIAEAGRFTNHQPAYYLIRQAVFIAIGVIAGGLAFQVRMETWQKYAPMLFLIGGLLLVIVLIPGIGRDVNGARRWLSLSFANLQPSELMKLFVVLYAADFTYRKINVMHDLKQAFLPLFGAMVLVGFLLLTEPDFGALVVIVSKTTFAPPGTTEEKPAPTHAFDTGAAWGHLALQAHLSGWHTHGMSGLDYERARQELKIPEGYAIQAMVAIGKLGDKASLVDYLQAKEVPSQREPLSKLVAEGDFSL